MSAIWPKTANFPSSLGLLPIAEVKLLDLTLLLLNPYHSLVNFNSLEIAEVLVPEFYQKYDQSVVLQFPLSSFPERCPMALSSHITSQELETLPLSALL